MKTTKEGSIIALKGICDYAIKKHKINKKLTQSQVDDIHKRGKITPTEKVEEWEKFDLCAPGNAIVSAKNRCHTFSNCYECLLEYANEKEEYDSIEVDIKIVNNDLVNDDSDDSYPLSYKKLD